MNRRTTVNARARRLSPAGARTPALFLGVAAAGALMVNVLTAGDPAAQADAQSESMSVAQQLGISAEPPTSLDDTVAPLQQLAASRSARDADQTAAQLAQLAAEQAEHDRRAAEEAARRAAEEAARRAAEEAARAEAARIEAARVQAARAAEQARAAEAARAAASRAPAPATRAPAAPAPSRAAAPSGSFQGYALQKLGGDSAQFSCLERLWGKESGWNPNAQNPRSSAYGIAQFLDSTWAGTGIAKTSDGYRQIDAGLIYINKRFGSPCGAWSHSQAKGWY
jgi:hypothetical protein